MRFRHFDHAQHRLTIFTKGGKVQTVPVVDPAFWNELERYILDWQAEPDNYLLCRRSVRPNRHKPGEKFVTEYRGDPMGVHGLHRWWYACLQRAGPFKHKLNEIGDRAIVRQADPYTERVRVSSTIKLTAAEREYVEWLRSRNETDKAER